MKFRKPWAVLAAIVVSAIASRAEAQPMPNAPRGCAELFGLPGLVWRGPGSKMAMEDLAAYAAPVFWLSPDEPTVHGQHGRDLRVPAAFPFESTATSPVIYYQVTLVADLPNAGASGFQLDPQDKGRSVLDLEKVSALRILYIAYFPEESGVGQHLHDVEPTEIRLVIGRANGELAQSAGYACDSSDYLIAVRRVTGQAHGNPWYYNILEVDGETTMPIHLLVEEGKHATATDKNADGYYTPGYDVSVRINDAWGIRDTIRGGTLFSGKFEAWMAKVRKPEDRVLPPLPIDSALHEKFAVSPADNAVYELRPYPSSTLAAGDALLEHKIKEKETPDWPALAKTSVGYAPIRDALIEGRELKPFSVAYRYDGEAGLAVAFPLLVVKNVQEPLSGGYLVNRMYFKDKGFRDWGWMLMYTPSASRWFDQYFAGGLDVDRSKLEDGTSTKTREFVIETGVKFRFRAPNRVFKAITDFWGFRAGVKSIGAIDIDRLSYVVELGAGVW